MKASKLLPGLLFLPLSMAVFGQSGVADRQLAINRAISSVMAVRGIGEVTISPEGKKVAWSESVVGQDGQPTGNSIIYVTDWNAPARAPVRITAGSGAADYAEHDIAWSPDGSRVAFDSDKESKGQPELYVSDMAMGGTARKLTNLKGFLTRPRWSPDGKSLAFLFTEDAPRSLGPTEATLPDAGVVQEHVFEQRLAVVDMASGEVRQLSPPSLYIYEYDWSPDSKSFAIIAAPGSGDDNWYIAQLSTVSAATGEVRTILKPAMQIAQPHWSPDAKRIAFIGGLMSDEGVTGGDIFTVNAAGGTPRDVTPGLKASASWLSWRPTGEIVFTGYFAGSSGVATLDPTSGRITTLWTGPETLTNGEGLSLSITRDHSASAVIRHSFEHPPEVWAGETGAWQQITHINASTTPLWGQARTINWVSDGMAVQGWLVYPQGFDSTRRYPVVVVVHGGPASQMTPHWGGGLGLPLPLATAGYFLFFPNPRGSYGQGEAFTRANVKDFGYGDLRDVLAGVDEVCKTAPIDKNRIGITGWSYGGFMTMWTVTQTTRFRAAVAGAGIANWQSYYGENGIDQWMIPYFGASVYDDPAVYAKSSPITFIKNVKTPTLIMVGDRDAECPAPQSYEFWHALKTLGVETQFVIYPNEGHAISRPENRRDILLRAASWFDQHLKE